MNYGEKNPNETFELSPPKASTDSQRDEPEKKG